MALANVLSVRLRTRRCIAPLLSSLRSVTPTFAWKPVSQAYLTGTAWPTGVPGNERGSVDSECPGM